MPYIPKGMRLWFQNNPSEPPSKPGELNFLITDLCDGYMLAKGLSYQTINDIVGALESAKLEFYRRVAGPYENEQKQKNGDVYHLPSK